MPLTASLTPPELSVDPGGAGGFTLEVANDGAGARDVRFEVAGAARAWAIVVPTQLGVAAGARARARVMVQVPRSPHVPPGPAELTVRVAAGGPGLDERAEAHAVVRVAAFAHLRASLSPRASRGRRAGRHTLHVENLGNERVVATLAPAGGDGALAVELERREVTVEPGEVAPVPVQLRARRPRLFGRPRSRPFQVDVRAERRGTAATAATAAGVLVQLRARWPLPAAAAFALVLATAVVATSSGDEGSDDGPRIAAPPPAATVADQTAACPSTPPGEPGDLLVQNFLFCPGTLTVARGSDLRWTNRDDVPHTVSADGDAFDTGQFARGEVRSVHLDTPGSYTYFCRLHPFMRGTVVVT